jgi:hypothetical protein
VIIIVIVAAAAIGVLLLGAIERLPVRTTVDSSHGSTLSS